MRQPYRGQLGIMERLGETGPLPSLNRILQDRRDALAEIERLRAALKPIADEVTLMDDLGVAPEDDGVLLMHATKGGTFMGISFSALRDIKNAYGQSTNKEG